MELMEAKQIHKPLALEIAFNQKEDLLELVDNKSYRTLIIEEAYKAIKDNIDSKPEKLQLFEIINLNIIISIDFKNFDKCLYSALKHFESIEDYDTCSTVKELLKQL